MEDYFRSWVGPPTQEVLSVWGFGVEFFYRGLGFRVLIFRFSMSVVIISARIFVILVLVRVWEGLGLSPHMFTF